MSDEYQDLCSTCNNYHNCIFRKNAKRPVFFCELFDDYVSQTKTEIDLDKKIVSDEQGSFSGKNEDSHYLIGLCSNCKNRGTCIYNKPEGGIWNCDEYL